MKWEQLDWLEQAEEWIRDELGRSGVRVTGPIEQPHVREWGTVLRVPTSEGNVYFKATTLELQNEAAVTKALSRWYPDLLPRLYAVDIERNWLLVADGGLRLRDAFKDGLAIDAWSDVLTSYARFQIDLAQRVEKLLSLGSPDRRLHKLPLLFAELMADTDWLMIGEENGISREEHKRLVTGLPHIEQLCRELAEYNIPNSLHHGDLHDGNIFRKSGRHHFFDWGDSVITHPFFSLRTVLVSLEYTFDWEENDPRFDDFALDYLNSWQQFGSRDMLWEAYQIARRLWSIPSVLQWKYVMSKLPGLRQEMDYAVPSLLHEVLEANPEI